MKPHYFEVYESAVLRGPSYVHHYHLQNSLHPAKLRLYSIKQLLLSLSHLRPRSHHSVVCLPGLTILLYMPI